ncbi:MAG: ChaN family lipoprotein [Phycisphaeraceae bacterium]|nr:MAG: ChaN family lipoprotein [Phycisphaeraceae bacterium]
MLKACVALGLLVLLMAGCASTGMKAAAEEPATLEPRSVPVCAGYTGSPVTWDDMVDAAENADVVVIGEMHGHELGLAAAAALWDDLLASGVGSPALCLEFFGRDQQAAIDDYLTDVTDEEAFRKATNRNDHNYPEGHRRMLEAAKAAGLPVYGSNSPWRYATRAREEGLDSLVGLHPAQRALFVSPGTVPDGPYRDRFFEQFRGMLASHGGEEQSEEEIQDRIEGYYRAQSVWDSTMAGTIAEVLARGSRPVVQVVGQFHSDHEGGLVQAIWRARPGAKIVSISMAEQPDFEGDDLGRADFMVDVGGE